MKENISRGAGFCLMCAAFPFVVVWALYVRNRDLGRLP